MSLWGWLVLAAIASYPLVGLVVARAYGKAVWEKDSVRKMVEAGRYNGAQLEVSHEQRTIVGAWPLYLVWAAWEWLHESLARSGDPHLGHRQEYDRQVAEYRRLDALEKELKVPVHHQTAEPPEPFCGCLPGVDVGASGRARDTRFVSVQKSVERARHALTARYTVAQSRLDYIEGQLDNIEYQLKSKGVWE